mgnify:FL=1
MIARCDRFPIFGIYSTRLLPAVVQRLTCHESNQMLKISDSQLHSRIIHEEGFVSWFAENFMREQLANFYIAFPAEKRMAAARRARNAAIRLEITDPPSQVHFAALMWSLGANFFTFPGFREILEDVRMSGPARIHRVYTEVTADQAADAILHSDDSALFVDPDDSESAA